MADWHVLHLTFDPPLDVGALEGLSAVLKELDYDSPVRSLSGSGTTAADSVSKRQIGDELATLWRSPMISEEQLIEALESAGAVGHGWLLRTPGGSRDYREIPADQRFTFGGGFPEIAAAAKTERMRSGLAVAVYTSERAVLKAARSEEGVLDDAVMELRRCDAALAAHHNDVKERDDAPDDA